MISGNLPVSLASIVAPPHPAGHQLAGRQDPSERNTPFQPVEELAASGRQQLRTRSSEQGLPTEGSALIGAEEGSSGRREQVSVEANRLQQSREANQLEQDQNDISRLAARDREVRAHEQAHSSVGGQYAGAAQYQYARGPDGVRYAVGGEVPIEIGRESTPEATLQKAETVKRAALAPAEPSPQDRQVAAEATRLQSEARRELVVEKAEESAIKDEIKQTSEQEAVDNNVSTSASGDERRSDATETSEPQDGFARTAANLISSRLSQGIANSSLSSREPGSILDQIV